MRNAPTLVTLVVALGGPPLLAAIDNRRGDAAWSSERFLLFQFAMWSLVALIVLVTRRVERQSLASIGLKWPNWVTLATGIGLAAVTLVLLPPVAATLVEWLDLPSAEGGTRQLSVLPAWARLAAAVTGGIVEETIYRGYAIERLASITGRLWLAGVIAALAFGLAHIPAWRGYGLIDFIFGLMATALYLWRRDLIGNIIAHATVLAVALLQLPQAG